MKTWKKTYLWDNFFFSFFFLQNQNKNKLYHNVQKIEKKKKNFWKCSNKKWICFLKKTHLSCWLLINGCNSKNYLQKENKVGGVPNKETQATSTNKQIKSSHERTNK
jgi:hypothetical protein